MKAPLAIFEAVLPGVLPATAGNVLIALVSSAPGWLVAVGQACIVALWCASAMKRMNRETADRLGTIEDAIRDLECVKRKRVARMTGVEAPEGYCPTPTPR